MEWDRLIREAEKAASYAYAPYSGFKVGVALSTDKGNIYSGCNVENSSYGLTMCAERIAVFKAVASGDMNFVKLVIYTDTDQFFYPCGACRQVLSEFSSETEIMIVCNQGKKISTIAELLPDSFKLRSE